MGEMGFWWAQQWIINDAWVFRDARAAGKILPVTLAVWDDGCRALGAHGDWLRQTCARGRAVMVLETTGVGNLEPNPLSAAAARDPYGALHKFNDDLMWLGDSLAALRTYDVLRALEMIAAWPGLDGRDIRGYAHGRQGVYLQLAAALDQRIRRVDVVKGMGRFANWVGAKHYEAFDIRSVVFPGILEHLDLDELPQTNLAAR